MVKHIRTRLYLLLKWSERYTKIDMVYLMSSNFWLLIGRVIGAGSGFLLTLAFANMLAPEAFGTYKYIVALAGFIGAFSLNGTATATMRAIGKGYQDVIPSLFRTSILWSVPASGIALIGGGYYLYMGNGTLGWSLVVIAIVNPLIANLSISKTLFIATGDFKNATYYNSVRSISQVVIIGASLLLTDSVLVIATTFFVASAIVGYATYWQSLRKLDVGDDATHLPETLRYAKHMSVIGFFQQAIGQIDQLLLWHFLGPVALATYSIAQGPTRELRALTESIASVIFPKFTRASAQHHAERDTAQRRAIQFFCAMCVIALAYIVTAPYLFRVFFPQYLDAIFYSQLIAGMLVLQPRNIMDMFLLAHSGIKDRYVVAIPGSIVKIALFVVLIPLYGVLGAIAAWFVADVVTTCITIYRYRLYRDRLLDRRDGSAEEADTKE